MEKMIAYCGLICTECEAFLVTQKDDDAERRRVAEAWSRQFGREIKAEDINCAGCLSDDDRHIDYWATCEIRKCARERSLANCAHCDDYACEKLEAFFGQAPQARASLEEIRGSL